MSNAPFDYSDLDVVFHAPARLSICTALYAAPKGMSFGELKEACDLTDGNLSRHLTRLEEETVLVVEKLFVGKRPRTLVSLSDAGRRRFESYLDRIRSIVEARAQGSATATVSVIPPLVPDPGPAT